MAQFIAEVQGNRGDASRLGSKDSGIRANARGWDTGMRIDGWHADGVDIFQVSITGGSHDTSSRLRLGTLKGDVFEPSDELRALLSFNMNECDNPEIVTCGNCKRSWCEKCDPAPSAQCHYCNGRGHSIAAMGFKVADSHDVGMTVLAARLAKQDANGEHVDIRTT